MTPLLSHHVTTAVSDADRRTAVRRGQALTWATIAYNSLEGLVAVGTGLVAGSVSLIGFGIDSGIEVAASLAALWRLAVDVDPVRRASAESRASRVIGWSFLALALYVMVDAGVTLWRHHAPEASPVGIAVAIASLAVMPLLARAKRRVAARLDSRALHAEARQTDICMYLSTLLLVGLGLNAIAGWWWADPVAALVMVPLIAWEGRETLRGRAVCDDCAPERRA